MGNDACRVMNVGVYPRSEFTGLGDYLVLNTESNNNRGDTTVIVRKCVVFCLESNENQDNSHNREN